MGSRRSFVILLLTLVQLQQIIAKPFFTELFCDYICDDDDDDNATSTQSSDDDYGGFFDICTCPTRRPNATNTARPNQIPNFNISLPALTNGLNFRMYNNNGQWTVDLSGGQNGGPPAGGSPPGGPATAAPTTAAGGATTAAGTTAAATTAKK